MGDLSALLSDVTWTCQQLEQIRHKQVKDHELLTKSFEKTLISILKQEHAILNQLAAEHEQLRDQLSSVMKINKVALQDGLAEISSFIEEISEISAQLRQVLHTSDTSEAVIKEMKERVRKIFSKETIINITLRKVYYTPQPLGHNTIGEVRYEKQTLGFTIPVPPKEGPASRVRCENPVVQRDDHASLENARETSSHPENVRVQMSKHESDLDSMPGPRAPSQREKKATIPYKQKISLSPLGYRSPSAQENRVLVVKKRPSDQRISCKNGISRGKTSKEGGKDKECKFSETKTSRLFIRSSPLKRCLTITRDNNLNSPGNPHILASDSHKTKNKESSNKKKRDEEELENRRDDADRDPKGVQEMACSGNQDTESVDVERQAGRQRQTNNIREDPTLLSSVDFQNNQLIDNAQYTDDKVALVVKYLTLDKIHKRPSSSSLRSVSPSDIVSPKCTFITEHAQDRKRDGKYRASCRFFQPRGKSNQTAADKLNNEALFRAPRSVSPAGSVSSTRTFIIERSKGKETGIESHATDPLLKSTTHYKKDLPVISPPAGRCETRPQHQTPKSMGLSHAKTLPKNVLNARNQLPQTRSSWKPVPKSTSTTCIEKISRPTSLPSGPFRSASSRDGKALISGSSDYQSNPKSLASTPSNVSRAFHMREKPSWSRKKNGRVSH